MHQELLTELRWFFLESGGDLGLKSNFESVARRIGGIYSSAQTSTDMDGRLLSAAVRHRRVQDAIRTLIPREVTVLHAFAYHELRGVMLIQKLARDAYRAARTNRSFPDWLTRIAPNKDKPPRPERQRLWIQIRADAQRELDRALSNFDNRWSRRA